MSHAGYSPARLDRDSECLTQAAPRTPAIFNATDRLHSLTESILNVVELLESKCVALLGPDRPRDADKRCSMEGPPLACNIHESCDRLLLADERLRVLLDRIEL